MNKMKLTFTAQINCVVKIISLTLNKRKENTNAMSTNKLALIRYKIIDQCLQQKHRKWTLEDLIEKVSEGLYELEGIHSGISKRTIQGDIQLMRSNKLGYNAPIVVKDRRYYSYEDPDYSISNSPISNMDMQKIKDALDLLKHLNGFSFFEEMSDMIIRLDNRLNSSQKDGKSIVQMEANPLLKGLKWITPLYQAIKEETPVLIKYKSFRSKQESSEVYNPYLLKEFRNRWFLIARKKNESSLITLALDRIKEVDEMSKAGYQPNEDIDFDRYFSDTIGVTKSAKDRGQKVILEVDASNAPYVETKPFHASQQLLKKNDDGSIKIRIDVVLNLELEREILGFGQCIKVIAPKTLEKRISYRLFKATKQYFEINRVYPE